MAQTAADVLVEGLIDWGVDTVFGIPGDGINGIMEALRTRQQRVRFVQVRHEEASVEFRWSTQDNNTVGGVPYIGKLSSGSEHVYVATGFKGWGMTNGHVAAMLLSDLILGRANPRAEVFDPSRFKPVTSARDFVRENMNVAKEFMADHVSTPGLESLDEIPLGHGEVVEWRGERVAVYKDERGAVSACSAVVPHRELE